MNLKLWIKKIMTALCVVAISIAGLGAKCNAAKTLQKLQDIADEIRLNNKSISDISNTQFENGKLDRAILAKVNPACEKLSKALDATDKAIAAGKLLTEGSEIKTALDFAERIIDTQVFPAFMGVAEAVVDVPPDIKEKIDKWIAAIRAAFALVRILLADAQQMIAIGARERYAD